jgi:hypothetical protein
MDKPDRLKTPVALLIFNRPGPTGVVFESIRQARPPLLLVVADGPRPDRPGEPEQCAAARAVLKRVDWECEVRTNFAEGNLGCKKRVGSGLDWVFDQVEAAIILEDDCVPHPSFFPYCEELLQCFRDDERVMAISGDNFQFGRRRTADSYYFSWYPHVWGWASWRRAWRHYDGAMSRWPQVRDNGWLHDLLQDRRVVRYWTRVFQTVYEGKVDTWDYSWLLACWLQGGLGILPNVNLVSNIGFGAEATHTRATSPLAELPVQPMEFPLRHPPFIIRDARADAFTFNKLLCPGGLRILARARSGLQRLAGLFHKPKS